MSQPANPRSRPARGTGSILVTGATGMLGRAVCARLAASKTRFRALVRLHSNRDLLSGTGAWMAEGDLLQPASLVAPLDGVQIVLHLAGSLRGPDFSVHVEGTRNLLAACPAEARIVAISSDTVLREHRSAYANSKADMEALLARDPRETVVLRPPMILGPGSPHLASLERAARLPVVPIPPSGRKGPVWVGDVADAVLAAAELEEPPDGAIDLPGELQALDALFKAVAKANGWRPPRTVSVSRRALTGAARLLGSLQSKPLLDLERLDGLAEEVRLDPALARELLGWDPKPLTEVLRRCYSSSDQNPM